MALFNECLRKGRLRKIQDSERMITKELATAKEDLSVAKEGLKNNRWKWSTIQAYYAMFHAARALLYSHGYSEHSHYCLRIAVEALFVQKTRQSCWRIFPCRAGLFAEAPVIYFAPINTCRSM